MIAKNDTGKSMIIIDYCDPKSQKCSNYLKITHCRLHKNKAYSSLLWRFRYYGDLGPILSSETTKSPTLIQYALLCYFCKP